MKRFFLKFRGSMDRALNIDGLPQLIVRIIICTVMWPHGAQLLLGWFGGFGFEKTMQFFTQNQHLPWLIGCMVIMIQFFGSIFIAIGYHTRLNAILMSIIVTGMIFSGHVEHGFFMNWFGQQAGEGFEFHLLLLGLTLSLVFAGAGKFGLDAKPVSHNKPYELYF